MLTRSTNASPCIPGFHYAAARSPRHSPSRISAAAGAGTGAGTRRPSSSSSPAVLPDTAAAAAAAAAVTSPLSRPLPDPADAAAPSGSSQHRYESVDASTQYSPMEPFDYAAHPHRYPPQPLPSLHPPPIPGPTPMEPGIEQGVERSSSHTDGVQEQQSLDQLQQQQQHQQQKQQQQRQSPHSYGRKSVQTLQMASGARVTSTSSSSSAFASAAAANSHAPAVVTAPSSSPQQQQQQQQKQQKQKQKQKQQHQTPSPNKRRSSQSPAPPEGIAADGIVEGAASPSSLARSPATSSKRVKAEAEPPKMLPERYELCAVEDMAVLIANMLSELIETNDALALKAGHLTRFHSRTAPGISVLDYLNRLAKHATLTPPLLLSMVYYIDRLCAMYPDFTINTLTVHRFLITAATVAAKGLSDSFWNNSTYARVGGVRVAELKMLELEFLYRLEWKIVPNPEVLAAYYRPLVERCPGYALPADTSDRSDGRADNGPRAGNGSSMQIPVNTEYDTVGNTSAGGRGTTSTSLIERDMVVSGPGPLRDSSP